MLAIGQARTSAELMLDVVELGYLDRTMVTLDPTWGLGRFWKRWRPDHLVGSDLDPAKSPIGFPVDFTELPWPRCFGRRRAGRPVQAERVGRLTRRTGRTGWPPRACRGVPVTA